MVTAMEEVVLTPFLIDVIIIAVSFVFLNYASNAVISYALKVAAITRLGKTSVGFTLISLSTTLPEMTVALIAATSGGAALSIGNVLGSNIFNISVIIGLSATLLVLTNIIKKKRKNNTNIINSFNRSELSSIEFGLFLSSVVLQFTYPWQLGLLDSFFY